MIITAIIRSGLTNIFKNGNILLRTTKRSSIASSPYFTKNISTTSRIGIYTTLRLSDDKISFNFINRKGEKMLLQAAPDDTLLDVVIDNDLDIESFGVCEGTLGCSTCHVILEEKIYNLLEKSCPPTAEEDDMLDLACGLTMTSRLACQVEIIKSLEGMTVTVPKEAVDARDL